MKIHVLENADVVGEAAATMILEVLSEHARGTPFLLGCPGGRSPQTTYAALARQAVAGGVDLSDLVIVMMDDYLRAVAESPVREDPAEFHSCERFGRHEIVDRLNRDLAPEHRIADDALWLPDPADPAAYDDRIREAGGIAVFVLASGAGDGHIAFNPPHSARDSRTRIVDLAEQTRRDNLATFPTFEGDLDRVPTRGITVGLGTIRDLSRQVVMVVHGADKRLAAERLSRAGGLEPDWPATIVADCANAVLLLDRAAAGD
ncbi:MAG: hypothetical protein JWQ93_3390 [Marmoricola sp.]|nr:hypothetical protein [Marmoricola sp.]MCW2837691.1 hypothetical protein [Marmoricola sp.]